jgi:hypothetical protein
MNRWHLGPTNIALTKAEIKSGYDRMRWAEDLILQLPAEHEGRNSWLLTFGRGEEAEALRSAWSRKNGRALPTL